MDYFLYFVIYFGGLITGAVCLEQLWYARRRRKHAIEDIMRDIKQESENSCPGCGGSGLESCRFCNGKGIVNIAR